VEEVRFAEGDKVITQGDQGDDFFIINEGKVGAVVESRVIFIILYFEKTSSVRVASDLPSYVFYYCS